jgi:hypothetical protein
MKQGAADPMMLADLRAWSHLRPNTGNFRNYVADAPGRQNLSFMAIRLRYAQLARGLGRNFDALFTKFDD